MDKWEFDLGNPQEEAPRRIEKRDMKKRWLALGILALVASSIGLTMTAIARSEIVQNAQYGDEFAVSGMVIGIVVCVLSVAALVLYFVLFQ